MKILSEPKGYAHARYAVSLKEFGEPRELRHCGGWILERAIPGTPYRDGMGCYPLFVCQDWSRLHEDMKEIASELVSLVLVVDPFATVNEEYLTKHFQIAKPFKRHFVADLTKNPESYVKARHRSYARSSLRDMQVEFCDEPLHYAEEWIKLYRNLIKRHNISGIRAFSEQSFLTQLETPGLIMVVGKHRGEVIAAHLIIICDDVAYYHLAAFSDEGYELRASYGLYWMTLTYLTERGIRYFDIGAAAGIEENEQDGLARFKRGWSNDSRIAYLCGSVLDDTKYSALVAACSSRTDYFPAYRGGEFG